ncbi:MAG: ROK family glucokinase [Actinomycetaceae bacterium]|nr:ROK family glucokinase [Actinomycetaceae bacterium]
MSAMIGIDIGGTKIAVGVVDENGTILASRRHPTPSNNRDDIIDACAALVKELSDEIPVAGIGVGAAGFVDDTRSNIIFAPNLAWTNEPLRDKLEQATGLPTVIENDANAAAWAEFRFGAARGASNVIVVTVGTGIGGGIIIDGQLLRGSAGFAGEIGHLKVKLNGRRCGCGQFGCWERYGSGRALVHEAHELAQYDAPRAKRLIELAGGDPLDITGLHISQAAAEGDPAAIECFDMVGTWLGIGMADLSAVLAPEMFVLAGGVSEAGELLRAPAIRALKANLTAQSYRPNPKVVLATLGNDAGIIGAADLARV